MSSHKSPARARGLVWAAGVCAGLAVVAVSVATVPTTPADFFGPGTQPSEIQETIIDATTCRICHGDYTEAHDIARPWAASMMGQAARDPVFWAGVAVANQDAANSGELCIRCHVPVGWLSGRSSPSDGSSLTGWDFDGVSCIVCHRMVDPVYHPGQSPAVDQDILASLQYPQVSTGNNTAVIDPLDRRRGPFAITAEYHRWEQSPFHQTAQACGNCHEVSNPALSREPDGVTYRANPLDAPHPTGNKYDMFPLDRTFSEWSQSAFAQGPVDMNGRFGGNKLEVSTCQDCHMPDGSGVGANPILGPTFRDDLPQHLFLGSNSWVLRAVRNLYEDEVTGLSRDDLNATLGRTAAFMQVASDMELSRVGSDLNVRIINQSGHKLPTGYHEGRRMWVNVRFFDSQDTLIAERGAYDDASATLSHDTKIYETKQGLDQYMSQLTGVPEGISFHQTLNNKIYRDNRIPPRGFTNAGFASVQCEPVAYTYADGQYWDDTLFDIPPAARRADVRFFYQTTSREYIEFLRDQNVTNNAGQVAYDQWLANGKSAPGLMDQASISLCPADFNNDGQVDFFDYLDFVNLFSAEDPGADFNSDGQIDFFDYLDFAQVFSEDC